jgi:hypothetical protein
MTKLWSWLLSAALVGTVAPARAQDKPHESETGTKVSLEQVPAAPRDELLRKAGGAPILDIVEERGHGHTMYTARVRRGDEVVDYKVDDRGAYMGRETEKRKGEHK